MRVCCGNALSVHGQLLPDLSISLDFRFGPRLVGASGGEESVDEKVSEFVAFIEGGLEGVEDIDHRFVTEGLRVLAQVGTSLWAEVRHVVFSWYRFLYQPIT